ncbi:IS6 family transposase [Bacillus anthracis]|uniref:IS6 family transposase n=1 Tax=Bacillus anthracis TaxID=1392 RepID=UPI00099D5ADF|nr:IS6 family transposase [Bacillus anthracis]OPD49227.1 hypothetical protein BVG01_31325 [Bacillus anthracis]
MKKVNLFIGRHYPPDVIFLSVYWHLRYNLTFRELTKMLAERGVFLAHTTIVRWVNKYKLEVGAYMQRYQKTITNISRIDESKIKVRGEWMYLYRTIDAEGDIMDFYLSKVKNYEGAKQFFERSL